MNKNFIQSIIFTTSACLVLIIIGLWQQKKITLPTFSKETMFFISTSTESNGQIMALDNDKKTIISKKNWIVDQFVLWQKNNQKKIFFLAKKKSDENEKNILFVRDLQSGKTNTIIDQNEFLIQKIFLHPKKKWLLIEKNNRSNYARSITMWDIANNKESPIPIEKAWVNFSFSPDGQTIVGLDTGKDVGFELSNFWQKNTTETVLGNFLQNFGFSPDGQNILFSQKKDNDIFSQTTDLVLYKSDGTKQIIFTQTGINNALWIDENRLIVSSHNQDFEYKIHMINIQNLDTTLIHDFQKTQVLDVSKSKNKIFVSIKNSLASNKNLLGIDSFSVYQWNEKQTTLEKKVPDAFGLQTF